MFLFVLSKSSAIRSNWPFYYLTDCCIFCVFYRIKEWVDQMQKDLIKLTDRASGLKRLTEVSVASRTSDQSHLKASFVFLFFCK